MTTENFNDPNHCNLCRKRAGLPPLFVVDDPPPVAPAPVPGDGSRTVRLSTDDLAAVKTLALDLRDAGDIPAGGYTDTALAVLERITKDVP